jgi:hypothetical protein
VLEAGDRLAVGRSRKGLGAGLTEVAHGLLPDFAPDRVVRQRLELLCQTVGMERLDRVDDPGVEGPAPLVEQAPVGHVVDERVLEGVLEIREQARLVEELTREKVGEAGAQRLLGPLGDGLEEAEGQKEGVSSGSLDQQLLEGQKPGIVAQQALEQLIGALGQQGIDAELPVVGLAAPAVLILRAIVDQQKQPRCRQALDQAVEKRLGLGVDPVQVLELDQDRLHLALAEQQALDTVERPLAALRRLQLVPLGILDGNIEQP